MDKLHAGKQKYSTIFNYPALTWADNGAIGWLVDGAAIMNQVAPVPLLYGPYSRAMIRICKEESFHQRQGFEILWTLMRGTPAQQAMAQDAVNRFWWPALMMFGPRDTGEARDRGWPHRAVDGLGHQAVRQRRAPPALRRHDRPQAQRIGVTLPDPDLRWNEQSGHWEFGEIDWDEFWAVLRGNGPCNAQRIATRSAPTTRAPGSGRQRWRMPTRRPSARRRRGRRKGTRHEHRPGCRYVGARLAVVGGLRPRQARAVPRPRWLAARPGRPARPAERPGPLHPASRGRLALGGPRIGYHREQPGRTGLLLRPRRRQVYRHPTFYEVPEDVEYL